MDDYKRRTRIAAKKYRKAGLSVIPVATDGSKGPLTRRLPKNTQGKHGFSQFADRQPTDAEICQMFPGDIPSGVAILAGAVSGGLEILDCDDFESWEKFAELVERECVGLLGRIPQVQSPRDGGGRHLYLWSENAGPTHMLAGRPMRDENGNEVIKELIAVRGHGSYCVAPGSDPKCHASGREYKIVKDAPMIWETPRITAEERVLLFTCARALDERNNEKLDDRPKKKTSADDDPGNIYMERETFASTQLLEKHGWKCLGVCADGRTAWARPGREDKAGFSALSGPDRNGHDRITVFSTAAGRLYGGEGQPSSFSLFQAYATLEHKGNFGKAAKALAEAGYVRTPAVPNSSHELPPIWAPFPLEVMPAPVDDYIQNVSQAIGVDPAFFVGPILAELAGAIGNSRRIRLKDGWNEPAVIWSAFLADSGMLKSPTMDKSINHLRRVQNDAFRKYREEMGIYEEAKVAYDDAMKRRKKTDAGIPPAPVKPICRRYLVDDTTIEALIERLFQNPRGVLLAADELAGWVLSMNQYRGGKGADVQHWLKMYGARSVTYDRKGQEPVFIPHAAVSVAGPVPPAVFRQIMGEEHFENGLVPRLLITMPPGSPKKWTEADISSRVDRRMQSLIDKLTRLEMVQDDHGLLVPVMVDIGSDAHRLWQAWYNHHGNRQADAAPHLKSAYSKLEGYCARIALIFHLVRHVRRECGDRVELEDFEAAIRVTEWFIQEAQRVYSILIGGQESEELIKLATWIHQQGGEVSSTGLHRKGPRQFRDGAEEWLERLVEAKWASCVVVQGKRGRPKTKYRLSGALNTNSSGDFDLVRHLNGKSVRDSAPRRTADGREEVVL